MSPSILRRTTFVVPDAAAAARFYETVFGWERFYDEVLAVDRRFPPAAPDQAQAHLVILKCRDPHIGMLGFLQYLESPFDAAVPPNRTRIRMGEPILVIETQEIDAVHERARAAGASIVSPPVEWQVPAPGGGAPIRLRTMSWFDPQGIYAEINTRLP